MLIPARSNSPPFEQKSFCMSTTITTVCEVLIVIGSGLALMVVCHPAPTPILVTPIFVLVLWRPPESKRNIAGGPIDAGIAVAFAYGVELNMLSISAASRPMPHTHGFQSQVFCKSGAPSMPGPGLHGIACKYS